MNLKNYQKMWVVFFCTLGWVCIGSANGAEDHDAQGTTSQDAQGTTSQDADTGLFDETEGSAQVTATSADGESDDLADEFGRSDIQIQEQDIVKVLQMLAIQSQRNILPSPDVTGDISAALYNVDFYEALDAILHTNGYVYVEEGNFIKVYTAAEYDELQASLRRMETLVVHLNYIPAEDAAKFLEPLISAGKGSIAASAVSAKGFAPTLSSGGENSYALPDTLVIHDYPEVIEEMMLVLAKLDEKPRQVMIEATILEARLSEDNSFGVDLNVVVDYNLDIFNTPINVVDNVLNGTVGKSTGGTTGGTTGSTAIRFSDKYGTGNLGQTTVGNTLTGKSGAKFGFIGNQVSAFVRALDQVTDTTVLAKPKIMSLNRQKAKLIAGEKLGYISTVNTSTSSTQTVEFLEVGTQLTVRPFISNDGFVRMELRPEISEGEVIAAEGFVIPNETTSELFANVIVPSGKTIVLGGLFKEDTTISRNQVPGLANLPGLGVLFKGQDDVVRRSEVIFLIKPTIMKDQTMTQLGNGVADDIETTRLGSRDALLPWSRSMLTASHLRDAHAYLAKGRKDKALLSVNMALTLDHTTLEAMRLKEELTGDSAYWPDGGILQDAISRTIDQQIDKTE